MLLATDVGYGHTKYEVNGKYGKFPSVIAPIFTNGTYGTNTGIEYNDIKYIVGKEARFSSNVISAMSKDFLIKYAPVLIHHIFQREKVGQVDLLCLSLSIAEYHKKKPILKKTCREFIINNKKYAQDIEVYPQGVGIWADMGKPDNALIIDIGYNTIDILTFFDGQVNINFSRGVKEKGVMNMINDIIMYVSDKYNHEIKPHEANQVLMGDGKINLFRKEYNLNDFIEMRKKFYSNKIVEETINNKAIKDISARVDKLIIAGGGAYFIDKETVSEYGIEIPENPEYSNVRGFHKLAETSSATTKKGS